MNFSNHCVWKRAVIVNRRQIVPIEGAAPNKGPRHKDEVPSPFRPISPRNVSNGLATNGIPVGSAINFARIRRTSSTGLCPGGIPEIENLAYRTPALFSGRAGSFPPDAALINNGSAPQPSRAAPYGAVRHERTNERSTDRLGPI